MIQLLQFCRRRDRTFRVGSSLARENHQLSTDSGKQDHLRCADDTLKPPMHMLPKRISHSSVAASAHSCRLSGFAFEHLSIHDRVRVVSSAFTVRAFAQNPPIQKNWRSLWKSPRKASCLD